jgi:uncharacterized protein Yka (UPF0111/DUF47 family)
MNEEDLLLFRSMLKHLASNCESKEEFLQKWEELQEFLEKVFKGNYKMTQSVLDKMESLKSKAAKWSRAFFPQLR